MQSLINQYNKIITELQKTYSSITPILQRVSALIVTLLDKNFSAGGRWDGSGTDLFSGGNQRWTPLSNNTISIYKKLGYSTKPTLNRTGRLRASIDANPYGKTSVIISANARYASIQQLGGVIKIPSRQAKIRTNPRTNKFAKKRLKRAIVKEVTIPAYDIRIPPRPYLTLTDADLLEIIEEIINYNNNALYK